MAAGKKFIESKIKNKLKEVQSADDTSIIIAINGLNDADKDHLLRVLTTISDKGTPKERSTDEKKPREEATFMANLKMKLDIIKTTGTAVRTDYQEYAEDLNRDMSKLNDADLIRTFNKLTEAVASLDVLKCLLEVKRGEIISILMAKGETIDTLEEKLKFNSFYIKRLSSFYKFVSAYPALAYTGYSFETLLRFKKLIETEAKADINFESSLKAPVDAKIDTGERRRVVYRGSLNPFE